MALQSEAEASKMTGEPGERVVVSTESEEEKKHKRLIDQSILLLNSGIDPKIVGQILAGGPSNIPLQFAGSNQGLPIADLMELLKDALFAKKSAELDKIEMKLTALESRLATPAQGLVQPYDPTAYAKQAADSILAIRTIAQELGWTNQTPAGASIEEVKEKYRHLEHMEEMKSEREHREGMRKIASDIPTKIGRGIAKSLREEESEEPVKHRLEGGLTSFECEKCHRPIYVPPEVGDTIHCGFCGAKYAKTGSLQQQQQEEIKESVIKDK